MKPPVSYYGGKQQMARHLLDLVPEHDLYVEPFLGGGALFWKKEPSQHEVINDLDDNIVNFYRVLQTDFDKLAELITGTLHSRSTHQAAKYVLKRDPDKVSGSHTYYLGDVENSNHTASEAVQRAWAFWVQSNMSYSAKLFGGFAYDRSVKTTRAIINKRDRFQSHYRERLRNVCIECNDAIKVIQSRDTANTFHYCDPPYYNSDCGHYDGYTKEDFNELLETLSETKGRFLLSSYPSDLLEEFTKANKWKQKTFDKSVAVSNKTSKKKTEVLTWNY